MNVKEKDGLLYKKIKKYLNENEKDDDILVYDKVSSTNTLAKEIVDTVTDKSVIVAKYQEKGKGRLGRTFFSPEKTGIYMSIIIKPNMEVSRAVMLTTLAAVCVVEAIKKVTNKDTSIKWVNDIFMDGKKLCGILTEASIKMDSTYLEYAIVGIGINVFEPNFLPKELENIVTSIYKKGETYDKDVEGYLIAQIINNFFEGLSHIEKMDYVTKYKQYSMVIGKNVFVIQNKEKTKAKVIDIDEECRLVVEYENKTREVISSGEISIRLDDTLLD